MASIRHHCFAHVTSDIPHDGSLGCSKRFFAADSKYRHPQFCLSKDFVVLRIPSEGRELCKASPHRPGLCILRRIIRSCSFVRLTGITCEVVPDAIQINSLASLDQPLRIGTMEREMP